MDSPQTLHTVTIRTSALKTTTVETCAILLVVATVPARAVVGQIKRDGNVQITDITMSHAVKTLKQVHIRYFVLVYFFEVHSLKFPIKTTTHKKCVVQKPGPRNNAEDLRKTFAEESNFGNPPLTENSATAIIKGKKYIKKKTMDPTQRG